MKSLDKKSLFKYGGLAIVIIALITAYFFTPLKTYFTADKVIEITDQVPNTFSSYAVFLLIFIVGGCLLMPMPLAAFAAGLIFPLWVAISLCVVGAFLASSSGYFLGRLIDLDTFGSWVKEHLETVKNKMEDKSAYAVLALRLAPTPPFTVTSIICGSLKLNYFRYVIASTAGILPFMLLVLIFGREMLEAIKEPTGITIATLVALAILVILYKISKKKVAS